MTLKHNPDMLTLFQSLKRTPAVGDSDKLRAMGVNQNISAAAKRQKR